MGYVLTEEQQFLKDSAKDLLKSVPVASVRELRDAEDANGFSTEAWRQMTEMGWPGLAISEDLGGLNFGLRGLGILMEEAGRTLSASPLMSVAVATKIIEKHGSAAQKEKLATVIEQGKVIALAIQEGDFYQPEVVSVAATSIEDGFSLSGTKDMVCDAHVADHIIVTASTGEGVTAFLVDAAAEGLTRDKEFMMDSRYYSRVSFKDVNVTVARIVGKEGHGKKVINDVTNMANALLSAELVGLMSEAFERTVAYLKERRQFDKAIGTFQGLQHRAADLYGEIELAKSLSIKALEALDEDNFMAPALASMAKVKCAKISQVATNEGVQMFGGIGMTDDEEIGFFMKRARVAAQQYGGYSYHLDRFAKMNGY